LILTHLILTHLIRLKIRLKRHISLIASLVLISGNFLIGPSILSSAIAAVDG
jgi:hypothetical protein